ncbi:MAG: TIGR04053 family radical SAM/SPASM domain-containing protein [Acidimicrobiales bacterium]|nr:TIGR04053 family radical SAM/SPASM domain-containing protein [Acidimicrobiales bacterium]
MTDATHRPIRTLHQDVTQRPFLVIWEVTRACQLVCAHCRADSQHHRDPLELSTDEGRHLLDELAAYGPPRPIVVLTGGDPFEREDLADLVAHGAAAGLHVALSPSVTPRLTRSRLTELHAAGASAVSLSLDGATAATHDGLRGVPGVFEATLEAAALVREVGFRLQVNSTVTRANLAELPALLGTVADLQAWLWSVFFLVPTGRGGQLEPCDAEQVEEVLHWLHDVSDHVAVKTTEAPHFRRVAIQRAAVDDVDAAFPPGPLRTRLRADTTALLGGLHGHRRAPRPPLNVNAGRGFAFVDRLGTVYPSGFLPLPAGSVREQPFRAIYRDSPLLRSLRDPAGFGGRCGRCEFREVCGGSRSHAYAVTGDPLAEDPSCAHVPAPGVHARAADLVRIPTR